MTACYEYGFYVANDKEWGIIAFSFNGTLRYESDTNSIILMLDENSLQKVSDE